MNIYLDLDGVFADFFSVAKKIIKQSYHSVEGQVAWQKLEDVEHLFLNLPMIEHSLFLYQSLQHNQPKILTALPKKTKFLITAEEDKTIWVRNNISTNIPVLTIEGGVNKKIYANNHSLLIDDSKRNIDAWEKNGGIGIHHINVFNTLKQCAKLKLL